MYSTGYMENRLTDLFMLGLIFMPLFACPFSDFFRQESDNIQIPDIETKLVIPENATAEERVDTLWKFINNPTVEKLCLKKIKKYAVEQGYSEAFVFSCTCAP